MVTIDIFVIKFTNLRCFKCIERVKKLNDQSNFVHTFLKFLKIFEFGGL